LKSGYANLPIGGLLDAIQENGVPGIAAHQGKRGKTTPRSDNSAANLLVVLDHREHVDPGQLGPAVQECEFHRERRADHFPAQLAY
jgi:hypothetical protein